MIITRTPLRISFFGGGTDIPLWYKQHGGAVLSTTIDKYLYITCRHMPPFWTFKHRFVYGAKTETVDRIEEIEHPSIRETLHFMNICHGIDLHYNTDIPARSGIGSSSSFTVGLLKALYGLEGKMVSDYRLAEEAIHIEQDMIKEAVGSQDQVAAAFGGFNRISFKKGDGFTVEPVTLQETRLKELNRHLVLVFTGFQRMAAEIEAEKIGKMNQNTVHLTRMAQMVDEAIEILSGNHDINEFGSLLHDSWMLKKSLSDKVSTSAIDDIYQIGRTNGAIGGKLLGAGGGGFLLFFVRPQDREWLLKSLSQFVHVPFTFETGGSKTVYYQAERVEV